MDADRMLVVADDLTGAVDAGHELAARGCPTVVSTDTTPRGDAVARAVTTASRRDDPTTAAATVADVVQDAAPTTRLYKKVDSTLRGNPVAEVDAALAATDRAVAAVAPVMPPSSGHGPTGASGTTRLSRVPRRPAHQTCTDGSARRVDGRLVPRRLPACPGRARTRHV
ncbi:MAG: hypothetical protein A07HB70_00680 [uncultured archaeon A07HB70]|nr:MAG: hypothetical protein A07HB70_00680 [uncultured archaeon A07HB70]